MFSGGKYDMASELLRKVLQQNKSSTKVKSFPKSWTKCSNNILTVGFTLGCNSSVLHFYETIVYFIILPHFIVNLIINAL